MLSSALNFCRHWVGDDEQHWYPLLAVYYLTYRCSFRCPYCSDGAGRPYYQLKQGELGATGALELLAGIRAHTEHVVLTGGEPCEYPGLDTVLGGIRRLGFESVVLTTNGHELDAHLPLPPKSVTDLVVSLDTLDAGRADACYGVPGAFDRIVATLSALGHDRQRRYRVIISAVVTPENLPGLYDVHRFSQTHGFRFAACPQLIGVHPHPGLRENPEYRRFFQLLLDDKECGADIHGTPSYLERMRDLGRFSCRPFTLLTVAPDGGVFYPCLEQGQIVGNLLEHHDLGELRRRGRERFGPPPRCGNQCHSACALGLAVLIEQPSSLVGECVGALRLRWKGRPVGD